MLRDIDLEVESHKTMAIVGSSGSGKSTLLRCINLLETPDSGPISLDGKALNFPRELFKHQETTFTKKAGMVPQNLNLFPHKTTFENIMGGPVTMLKKSKDEACQDAMELSERAELEDKRDSYSHQLSGGQQQRIAIARALAMKPEILLFDEPTSAFDPELGAGTLSLIKELSRGEHTIIAVAHNISFAREVSEEVVFVEKREILVKGSYDELVNLHDDRISQFLNYLDQGDGRMDIKAIKNIICFGLLIMDISVCCDKVPAMDETVYTYGDYNVNPGGEGGNQSVATAGSGGNVTLIGRITVGKYAHQLIHSFQRGHIDTSQLKIDKSAKTGVAFVQVDMERHSKCVCSLGVNAGVTPRDVRSYAHSSTDNNIVMTTLEHSSQLLKEISLMTRQNSYILIADPSPGDYSKLSPKIVDRIDILKPNKVEMEMLAGVRVEIEKDAIQAIHTLKEKGIRMPVISLGSHGAVYKYRDRVIYVEDLRINAVNTTAAGDTFIGSMVIKLLQGYSFRESIDYANRVAVYCVQHKGAQISIPFEKNVL